MKTGRKRRKGGREKEKKERALELLKYRQLKRGISILASWKLNASLKTTIHVRQYITQMKCVNFQLNLNNYNGKVNIQIID